MKLGIATVFLALAAFAQEGPPPGAPKPDRPKPAPKNLKLIEAGEVRAVMGAFTKGLGVQCGFCHVQGDFASDENPHKDLARKMLVMTRDVNKNFDDGKQHVTCYTCHRGAAEPLTAPPAQ